MAQTTISLDDELKNLVNSLLAQRKTKNRSQIIREALWCYAEKILPKNDISYISGINNNINCTFNWFINYIIFSY